MRIVRLKLRIQQIYDYIVENLLWGKLIDKLIWNKTFFQQKAFEM